MTGELVRNTDWYRVVFPNHGRSRLIHYHDHGGEVWSKSKINIGSKNDQETINKRCASAEFASTPSPVIKHLAILT